MVSYCAVSYYGYLVCKMCGFVAKFQPKSVYH